MATFVFRNHTVEPFLGYEGMTYSGYDDISVVPHDVDRYIWFYQVPVNADAHQLAQEVESYCGKLDLVLNSADERKPFIIFSMVDLARLRLTGADTALQEAIMGFNSHVAQLSRQRSNVKWVDLEEFTSRYGTDMLINWKFYLMSQTLLNPKLASDFHIWWSRIQDQLDLKRKKCLVLDLDNTLWGGVLGEDGPDGIQLGGDYPGKAYTIWQHSLLQLTRQGVILAVCSKNNLDDVLEAWDANPAMVLKQEHFAAMRINWLDKASNLQSMAEELNIGLDSMVFVDDNPAERELIKQLLPQVEVPDFPDKPYLLMPFYRDLVERFFRAYVVTDEDRSKTEQYRANALRHAEQAHFADLESYLYSLDIELDIMPADEHNLPRIAQMTQKTNQFNLTTRRYTQDQLRQFIDQGWMIYCVNVSDRFGDSGITGTICLKPVDDLTIHIDSLLLSCRVLGKGIEEAFVKTVFNLLRLDGYRRITADYLPTAKNGQTAAFYDRMGMACSTTDAEGAKHYQLSLDSVYQVNNCYNIKVK